MVLASHRIFVEILAKFGFVTGGVVKLFDFIVRSLAVAVQFCTWYVTVVVKIGSSAILLIMET